ncbi:hypothetical protein D3C80_1756460 [compost metagenome]
MEINIEPTRKGPKEEGHLWYGSTISLNTCHRINIMLTLSFFTIHIDTYTAPSAVRKLTQLCPKRIDEILHSTSPDPLILFEHEVRQILLFGFIRDIYHKEWNREEDCS